MAVTSDGGQQDYDHLQPVVVEAKGVRVNVTVKNQTYQYEIIDQGIDKNSAEPASEDNVVSALEAGRNAAEFLTRCFYERLPPRQTANVSFRNVEGVAQEQYLVSFDDLNHYTDPALFNVTLDAATGEPLSASFSYEPGESTDPSTFDWETYDNDDIIAKTYVAAVAYVNNSTFSQHAGAFILPSSYIDGVQATFRSIDPVCSDAYMHIESGPCYWLRIHYPSMTVAQVHRYPLCGENAHLGANFDEFSVDSDALNEERIAAGQQKIAPTPTPMLAGSIDENLQIGDEAYLLIALTAQAAVGDEYSPKDLGLSNDASFHEVCNAWVRQVMFEDALRFSVGASEDIPIASLDDPALKKGMKLTWSFDKVTYAGIYLGDGKAVSLTKQDPYKVRMIDLDMLMQEGTAKGVYATRYFQGA